MIKDALNDGKCASIECIKDRKPGSLHATVRGIASKRMGMHVSVATLNDRLCIRKWREGDPYPDVSKKVLDSCDS